MGNMTIRNIPEPIHNALRERATLNRRSIEAEVRTILVHSIMVSESGGFGQKIRARFADCLGDELDLKRDKAPGEAAVFEE